MMIIDPYRFGVSASFILDDLSITPLDVLAFKKLTVNAGLYAIRTTIAAVDYDIGWDANNELSSSSPVFDTSGVPTGDTLGDLGYNVPIIRWYEQTSAGVNFIPSSVSNIILDDSGTESYNVFSNIYYSPSGIGGFDMNNASSLGALPVSFYAYDKPSNANSNLYYLGNTGINPTLYIREPSALYTMRNGGSPFLSLGTPRTTWGHELANFTASGTGQTHYINNVLNVTGTSNNTTQFTTFKIGGGALFRFAISFDGVLNDPDRTTLYNYMATFY